MNLLLKNKKKVGEHMAWIEKRGNKHRVYWYVDGAEARRRKFISFDSPDEADAFKKKLEYQHSIGIIFDPVKMSFGEYLDYWLNIHKDNIAPKTYISYFCEIKNHIKPNLGNIKLLRLTPMQLQNYYSRMLKEGKANSLTRKLEKLDTRDRHYAKQQIEKMLEEDKGGLSSTTVNYHHRIIHKALKQAYKWQMVGHNIADAVEPPKKNRIEIEYMAKTQIHEFISMIKKSADYEIIITAIFTGMRQGELLGLCWPCVFFEKGIMRVEQQLQYIPRQGYFFREPKQNSQRNIPMPLIIQSALLKHRKKQEQIKAIYQSAGEEYNSFNLVFCTPEGKPMDGTALTKRFQNLLEKHGLPKMRFYSLRHTFATMCRSAGVHLGDIQDLLGHADISTTKNMYTHIEIEPLQKAIDKLENYMSS